MTYVELRWYIVTSLRVRIIHLKGNVVFTDSMSVAITRDIMSLEFISI